jgi:hypothetical protein
MTISESMTINVPTAEFSLKLGCRRAKLMPILMQKHVKKGLFFAIFLSFMSLF